MAHVADGLRVVLQAWHFELYVKYVRKYQNTPLSDKINKKNQHFCGRGTGLRLHFLSLSVSPKRKSETPPKDDAAKYLVPDCLNFLRIS